MSAYDELEPYHDLFEKLWHFRQGGQPPRPDPAGRQSVRGAAAEQYPQRPLEITEAGLIFKETVEREFGFKPYPSPAANSPDPYLNPDGMRLGACQYCGHCERFICEANTKGTPEVLLYPWLEKQPKFELRRHCQVTGLDFDRTSGRVRGVQYLDLTTGQSFLQPGATVVLAAFTLTNTRLLLSAGIGHPYDPASGTGVVGKNFCYQANSGIALFSPTDGSTPSSPPAAPAR